jgi:hypothetical protein
MIEPVGLDAKGLGELRYGQKALHVPRARPVEAVNAPMLEPNGLDRAPQQRGALGRAKPLLGQQGGDLLVGLPQTFQFENTLLHRCKVRECTQRADRNIDICVAGRTAPPDDARMDLVASDAVEDDFLNQAT